jgi:hypothetical protein
MLDTDASDVSMFCKLLMKPWCGPMNIFTALILNPFETVNKLCYFKTHAAAQTK